MTIPKIYGQEMMSSSKNKQSHLVKDKAKEEITDIIEIGDKYPQL